MLGVNRSLSASTKDNGVELLKNRSKLTWG